MPDIAVCKLDEEFLGWVKATVEGASGYSIRFYPGIDALAAAVQDGYRPDLVLLGSVNPGSARNGRAVGEIARRCAVLFVPAAERAETEGQPPDFQAYLLHPLRLSGTDSLLEQIENRKELEKLDPMKITARKRGASFEISCPDVVYIESQKHDVILHSRKEAIRLAGKLDTFEEMLKPSESFLRCHQSFIVNMDYISDVKGLMFCLKTGEAIPIRKRNAAAYKSAYLAHKLKAF